MQEIEEFWQLTNWPYRTTLALGLIGHSGCLDADDFVQVELRCFSSVFRNVGVWVTSVGACGSCCGFSRLSL